MWKRFPYQCSDSAHEDRPVHTVNCTPVPPFASIALAPPQKHQHSLSQQGPLHKLFQPSSLRTPAQAHKASSRIIIQQLLCDL
jgi:hypothetical protein